jgi:hypothetical protein
VLWDIKKRADAQPNSLDIGSKCGIDFKKRSFTFEGGKKSVCALVFIPPSDSGPF